MPLDQNPHQIVTRFGCVGLSMYACGFSMPKMRQFCLFTYPPRLKWASSEKMIFFLPKSATSVSQSVAIFPSVVQVYTLSHSFGGRIKLICQIRHELRVTIHEVSTSWKKTLDGGPYMCYIVVVLPQELNFIVLHDLSLYLLTWNRIGNKLSWNMKPQSGTTNAAIDLNWGVRKIDGLKNMFLLLRQIHYPEII